MLWNKMDILNETPRDLAVRLGISYTYLMCLARGERPIANSERKVLKAAADYLEIPVAQAYLHSGALKPSDFIVRDTAEAKIANMFERMKADHEWSAYTPSKKAFDNLDPEIKILTCLLYERVSKRFDFTSVVVAL